MTSSRRKIKTLAAALCLLLAAGCGGIRGAVSEPASEDGRAPRLTVLWAENVGAMSPLLQPAITLDGERICTVSRRGVLSFLNAADGERARLPIALPGSEFDDYTAGAGCAGDIAAAVSGDGWLRVYHALDGFLWQKNLKTRVFGAPLTANGKLFVIGLDGRLLAYTLKRGGELWRYVSPLENLVRSPVESSLQIDRGIVYAGIDNGALVALDQSSGRVQWENTVSIPGGNNKIANILDVTTPAISGDIVCAAAYQGGVSCFRRDSGERLWHYVMDARAPVAFDDRGQRLFAADADGALHAFDAVSGELLWREKTGLELSAPLFAGGVVLAGDAGGNVHAFFAGSGKAGATLDLDAAAIIHLRALPDGDILALAADGWLARVQIEL